MQIVAMLPLGVALQSGASVRIDDGGPMGLAFTTCDRSVCYAEVSLDPEITGKLKHGAKITYSGTDESGAMVSMPVTLAGFAAALDGPAKPREEYNEEQKKIANAIRAKSGKKENLPDR